MQRSRNFLSEFIELTGLLKPETGSPDCGLILDLRIEPTELLDDEGDSIATVAAERVYLRLDLDGFEIKPGIRLGDDLKSAVTIQTGVTNTTTETKKAGLAANLAAKISSAVEGGIAVEGGVSKEIQNEITEERTSERVVRHIRALPGDRWVIKDQLEKTLSGSYLADDLLCILTPVGGSNRQAVAIHLEVKQRDLHFERDQGIFARLKTNHAALAKIVAAKAIAKHGDQGAYLGTILLSVVEIENA